VAIAVAVVAVELGLLALIARAGPPPGFATPDRISTVLVLAQGVALVWRRRSPLPMFGVVLVANTAFYVLDYPLTSYDFGLGVALFSVAAYGSRRTSILACATVFVLWAGLWLAGEGAVFRTLNFLGLTTLLFFASAMWVWGRYVRARRAEFAAHAERAQREREEQARRAVAEERARIARELHDVVAHHMSVMVIQAGAARQLLDQRPERARTALAAVEEAGRQGLTAMPGLLRALRGGSGAGAVPAPQPTVAELDALAAQVTSAGLPVAVRTEGRPRPLPPGIDLSAYRIVQEALTNTRKHAGAAHAEVVLRFDPGVLTVRVTDDGHGGLGQGWSGEAPGGHGLLGMRERVEVFGGELRAGARPEGGYEVEARFPLPPAAARPAERARAEGER
jgi:signal transduction histidine kinase